MLFLNFFKLAGYAPAAIYKWFMEMVALDAFEWVMWSNIAAMGMYDDRFMSKPYVSSSAYVLRMGNYPKGEWCNVWNAMYYGYLVRNKKMFKGKSAVLLRNLAYFERLDVKEQRKILGKTKNTSFVQ